MTLDWTLSVTSSQLSATRGPEVVPVPEVVSSLMVVPGPGVASGPVVVPGPEVVPGPGAVLSMVQVHFKLSLLVSINICSVQTKHQYVRARIIYLYIKCRAK